MGIHSTVVIHTNTHLSHQVEWARYLRDGIEAHGDTVIVTAERRLAGDAHIVQGPHYARNEWIGHPRVLWLDRCFWGDAYEHVSLAWMRPDGSRIFPEGMPDDRPKPAIQPWKTGEQAVLVLADYGQDISGQLELAHRRFARVYARHHPQDPKPTAPLNLRGELSTALSMVDAVVGCSTTAIIAAVLSGTPAICLDPRHPARPVTSHDFDAPLYRGPRGQWLNDLSYAQWHMSETAQAWEYLSESRPAEA